jgi:AcrR family transcriptional regulator
MVDHRSDLIEAGLKILREEGLAGFTQARVAAKVGLRQGHLTYYFPTRTALLAAVARSAIEVQLAALVQMVRGAASPGIVAETIAAVTVRHQNTRVLVALNQAADQEPELRALFNELTDGFVLHLGQLLRSLDLGASEDRIDLVHALFVGLSVIDLATSRQRGRERNEAALTTAFHLLSPKGAQDAIANPSDGDSKRRGPRQRSRK